MRALVFFMIFAGWTTTTSAAPSSDPFLRLLEKTGLTRMLQDFPTEIQLAANRHAKRCNAVASEQVPAAADLADNLMSSLRQQTSVGEVKQLVDWYVSATGRKIRKLERREIDENLLQQHIADSKRLEQVRKIYHNTDTGRFIANVAVEIEYAGWRLSGCMQSAASSGDLKRLKQETVRAQVIRGEAATLIALFEEDTIRSMEFAFLELTDEQVNEYLQATIKHKALFAILIDSLLKSIDFEAKQIKLSAIR